MDAKPNARKEVIDFIEKHKKFMAEFSKLNAESVKYGGRTDTDFEMRKWRFKKNEENSMDVAWSKLTPQEKKELAGI